MTTINYTCGDKVFQLTMPDHARAHEWQNGTPGNDAISLFPRMFALLRTTAPEGMFIKVSPSYYIKNGKFVVFPGDTVNLTDYIPLTPNTSRLIIVCLDTVTNELAILSGNESLDSIITQPILPQGIPENYITTSIVKVRYGITEINEIDITDARVFSSAMVRNNVSDTLPLSTDDANDGYEIGSRWYDTTSDKEYVCLDTTVGAAVWKETTGGQTDEYWEYIDRCGFVDNTQTTISFSDSTYIFTLAVTDVYWQYFRSGVVRTIVGNKTVTLPGSPPTAAFYYIYIDADDGTLTASTTAWSLEDAKLPVATIWWNNSNTPKYWLADERHTCLVDRRTHLINHLTTGSKFISGGVLTGYTVAPSSPADTDNTFAISETRIADEDLLLTLPALSDPNGTATDYVILYRTNTTTWTWEASAMPYRYTAAGYIQYDNAATMTQGQQNDFYNTYLIFTDIDGAGRFGIIHGRAEFTSLALAQAEDVTRFDFTGLNIAESVIAYRLTWGTNNSYSTKGKCRLAATPQRINVATSSAASGATLHNALGGLQGGATGEYYHLTATEQAGLTGGAATTLHTHGLDTTTVSKLVGATDGTPDAIVADTSGNLIIQTAQPIKGQSSNFPAIGTTTLAEKLGHIYLGTSKDIFPFNDAAGLYSRLVNNWVAYTDHLTSLPTLTWAGYAGYTSPSNVAITNNTFMSVYHTAASRHFGYVTASPTSIAARLSPARLSTIGSGIRIDDGSGNTVNNAINLYAEMQSSGLVVYKYRKTAAGTESAAVSLFSGQAFMAQFVNLLVGVSGNVAYMYVGLDTIFTTLVAAVSYVSFTPSRRGFYHAQSAVGGDIQSASFFDAWV